MTDGPVYVMGGLPLIADVYYSGPDYEGEYDAEVQALYWRTRTGQRGKQISEKLMERIRKRDPYWESHCIEQVDDYYAGQEHEKEDEACTATFTFTTKSADS